MSFNDDKFIAELGFDDLIIPDESNDLPDEPDYGFPDPNADLSTPQPGACFQYHLPSPRPESVPPIRLTKTSERLWECSPTPSTSRIDAYREFQLPEVVSPFGYSSASNSPEIPAPSDFTPYSRTIPLEELILPESPENIPSVQSLPELELPMSVYPLPSPGSSNMLMSPAPLRATEEEMRYINLPKSMLNLNPGLNYEVPVIAAPRFPGTLWAEPRYVKTSADNIPIPIKIAPAPEPLPPKKKRPYKKRQPTIGPLVLPSLLPADYNELYPTSNLKTSLQPILCKPPSPPPVKPATPPPPCDFSSLPPVNPARSPPRDYTSSFLLENSSSKPYSSTTYLVPASDDYPTVIPSSSYYGVPTTNDYPSSMPSTSNYRLPSAMPSASDYLLPSTSGYFPPTMPTAPSKKSSKITPTDESRFLMLPPPNPPPPRRWAPKAAGRLWVPSTLPSPALQLYPVAKGDPKAGGKLWTPNTLWSPGADCEAEQERELNIDTPDLYMFDSSSSDDSPNPKKKPEDHEEFAFPPETPPNV